VPDLRIGRSIERCPVTVRHKSSEPNQEPV
jgi:hypothetical protein